MNTLCPPILSVFSSATTMFHVKLLNSSANDAGWTGHRRQAGRVFWPVSAWVGAAATQILLVLASASPPVQAAIHKCTGADGKVAFSDQPCAGGQSAATVKPVAAAPAVPASPNVSTGSATTKDRDAESSAAARGEGIRSAPTPECVALGNRIAAFMQKSPCEGAEAEAKPMFDWHEQQCAAQARAVIGAENARSEARQKQFILDEECKEKGRVLAERRPRLASLSNEDKKTFAAVKAEVARVWR